MSCGLDICYCQSNSIIYNILYCFNTSHVTLYPASPLLSNPAFVSIHLMLLFIGTLNPWTTGTMVFQYISCYSLSNAESGIHFHAHAFQYISCYSLSEKGTTFVPSVDTFQYISCYSLSARQAEYEHMRFTFQYISCYSLSVIERLQKDGYVRFNTSHVTLYR